jgi:hypothetical protein
MINHYNEGYLQLIASLQKSGPQQGEGMTKAGFFKVYNTNALIKSLKNAP